MFAKKSEMKQFFKMMFASALGALVAIGVIVVIGIFTIAGIVATVNSNPAFVPKENTVFKLSLNGSLSENVEENPFAQLFGNNELGLSLKDVVKAIRDAKANVNIKGIYIEGGALFSAGTPSIEVVRSELIGFKESGKFVVAYSENYTQGTYYLCSVADKVFMNPQGLLLINGRASTFDFYKGLANKAGIELMVFKVGTYKGAVEPYMLDKLSAENREQITSYQQELWGSITKGIAASRNLTVSTVNEYADKGYFLQTDRAVAMGFVDELKYKPEVEEYVKELASQTGNELKTASLSKMRNIKETPERSLNKIAVLYAEGEIAAKVVSAYSSNDGINEDMADAIIKLRKDDDVKAIVLRVNSPGGSAFISEQIWHEVVEAKKVKPVVVSMGNLAASGGYYIACAASKIFAEPTTLTGSIGVFGVVPNLAGLYKKLDMTSDVVKTNKFSDLGTVSRPWSEDEKALMQGSTERWYDTFLTRCAEGRNMSKEAIDKIGQGRVWTGSQALERGLVDELGGMDEAIKTAADMAGVSDNYRVTYSSGKKDFLMQFIENQLDNAKVSMVESVIGADEYKNLKTLKRMKSQTGILARLPYEYDTEL